MKMKVIAMLAAFALTASAVQAQELPRQSAERRGARSGRQAGQTPLFRRKEPDDILRGLTGHKQNEDFTIELEQNHRAESDNIHGLGDELKDDF